MKHCMCIHFQTVNKIVKLTSVYRSSKNRVLKSKSFTCSFNRYTFDVLGCLTRVYIIDDLDKQKIRDQLC